MNLKCATSNLSTRSQLVALVIFFAALKPFALGDESVPTWMNASGKAVQAEFIELDAGVLVVEKDGKRFRVALTKLIAESRHHAKTLAAAKRIEQRYAEAEPSAVFPAERPLREIWDQILDGFHGPATVLELVTHSSEITRFLSDKLQPVKISQDELRQLLTDLSSDKVDEWREAYQELLDLNPLLAMDIDDLMALESFQKFPYRNRLVDVITGQELDSPYSASGLEFQKIELLKHADGTINFSASEPAVPNHGKHGYSAKKPGDELKPEYTAITHGLAVLEYLDTPEAIRLIERMASGDPRVSVTLIAQKILNQRSEPSAEQSLEDHWKSLVAGAEASFNGGHAFNEYILSEDRSLLALIKNPSATMELIAQELQPLNISREGIEQLLADFSSDEESRWRNAYDQLRVFSPLLEFSVADLLERPAFQEYPARHRLIDVLTSTPIDSLRSATTAKFEFVTLKEQPVFGQPGICMEYRGPDPTSNSGHGSRGSTCFPLVSEGGGDIGLIILAMFKTPEANDLLKSIATGHPKMAVTMQAKAILQERQGNTD